MPNLSMKNILHANIDPRPGRQVTDSNRFPSHEGRMKAHINRIRNHRCERTDGKKCPDCMRGKR